MNKKTVLTSIADFQNKITWTYDNKKINLIFNMYEFDIEINIIKDLINVLKEDVKEDILNTIQFNNCTFNKIFKLGWNVTQEVSFNNSIFKQEVTLERIILGTDVSFINTTFEQNVSFSNSTFKGNVRFYMASFKGKANFDNTKFDKLADFWNAKFYHKTIFYKTDFLGTTVFSATLFKENVLFSYALIDKLIIFRDTRFNKGLDLSLAIIAGKASIFSIEISNFDVVKDIDDVFEFGKYIEEDGLITYKNKRETFRIIKNQLLANQNSIDALYFSSLEMKAYADQLRQNIFVDKKSKKWIEDFFILKLNWLSNNHGTSWLYGIIFTISIGFLFFYFGLISTENYKFSLTYINYKNFEACFKYFVTFLLPTHDINYMIDEKPSIFFYLWDFIGRIFVSYGIYQTIQAFRKYKNK